jgi:hypothetical protein
VLVPVNLCHSDTLFATFKKPKTLFKKLSKREQADCQGHDKNAALTGDKNAPDRQQKTKKCIKNAAPSGASAT